MEARDFNKMKTQCGNIWDLPADYRVITTNGMVKYNGAATMGKGIALQAVQRYPKTDTYQGINFELGNLINKWGNHVFKLSNNIISFPTKHDWKKKSDLKLIKRSAEELVFMLSQEDDITVLLPPPGCGTGGLKWVQVETMLSNILKDDKFIVMICPEMINK